MKFVKKFEDEFNKLEWPRLSQFKKYKPKKEIEITKHIIDTIKDCFIDVTDYGCDLNVVNGRNDCSIIFRDYDFSDKNFTETLRFAIPYLIDEFNMEIMKICCNIRFDNPVTSISRTSEFAFETLEKFISYLESHTHMYNKSIISVMIFLH